MAAKAAGNDQWFRTHDSTQPSGNCRQKESILQAEPGIAANAHADNVGIGRHSNYIRRALMIIPVTGRNPSACRAVAVQVCCGNSSCLSAQLLGQLIAGVYRSNRGAVGKADRRLTTQ